MWHVMASYGTFECTDGESVDGIHTSDKKGFCILVWSCEAVQGWLLKDGAEPRTNGSYVKLVTANIGAVIMFLGTRSHAGVSIGSILLGAVWYFPCDKTWQSSITSERHRYNRYYTVATCALHIISLKSIFPSCELPILVHCSKALDACVPAISLVRKRCCRRAEAEQRKSRKVEKE